MNAAEVLLATVILDPEWPTPERVVERVAAHRPTVLFSVPTLYHKLLQAGAAGEIARLGVRHCVSAGEALPQAVRAAWREASGIEPVSGYGTTETLCLMLRTRDGRSPAAAPAAALRALGPVAAAHRHGKARACAVADAVRGGRVTRGGACVGRRGCGPVRE